MKEKRTYSKAEIAAAVFCGIGCILAVVTVFIDSDIDLWSIALAMNGIGLCFFMFGKKSVNSE